MQEFTLSYQSLSISTPYTGDVPCVDGKGALQWDEGVDIDTWMPDATFIPKRKFKRLSRLSKMSLYTAHHATSNVAENLRLGAPIFCSRYGEFQHTMNVLDAIQTGELVSPMDFSYSVHNTGQGLFSILNNDEAPATALSARYDLLEQALVKAYAQLCGGDEAVLIVYAEDKMSGTFQSFLTANILPMSFAFVVTRPPQNAGATLSFSYRPSLTGNNQHTKTDTYDNSREQTLLQMLAKGQGAHVNETDRLRWEWCCE